VNNRVFFLLAGPQVTRSVALPRQRNLELMASEPSIFPSSPSSAKRRRVRSHLFFLPFDTEPKAESPRSANLVTRRVMIFSPYSSRPESVIQLSTTFPFFFPPLPSAEYGTARNPPGTTGCFRWRTRARRPPSFSLQVFVSCRHGHRDTSTPFLFFFFFCPPLLSLPPHPETARAPPDHWIAFVPIRILELAHKTRGFPFFSFSLPRVRQCAPNTRSPFFPFSSLPLAFLVKKRITINRRNGRLRSAFRRSGDVFSFLLSPLVAEE